MSFNAFTFALLCGKVVTTQCFDCNRAIDCVHIQTIVFARCHVCLREKFKLHKVHMSKAVLSILHAAAWLVLLMRLRDSVQHVLRVVDDSNKLV